MRQNLVEGFHYGFFIGCAQSPEQRIPPANSSAIAEKIKVARKIVADKLKLKRVLGPYENPPLNNLICSPLNLVEKAGSKGKYNLVHNLAYPYDENSINANIPNSEAEVSYAKFDEAIKYGIKHGVNAKAAKLDFDMAFRNFLINLLNLHLLGFTLEGKYYINSSMAFGGRSSCKIFKEFACIVQWIIQERMRSRDVSHYLDDFIMVHKFFEVCQWYMHVMEQVCEEIGAPLAPHKTEGTCSVIQFLGLVIDFLQQVVMIPEEKVDKTVGLINEALETLQEKNKNKKGKVTVKLLQCITGLLNFLCKAIPSGHPFLGRMYQLIAKASPKAVQDIQKLNPSFKVRLTKGAVEDLKTWKDFLTSQEFA